MSVPFAVLRAIVGKYVRVCMLSHEVPFRELLNFYSSILFCYVDERACFLLFFLFKSAFSELHLSFVFLPFVYHSPPHCDDGCSGFVCVFISVLAMSLDDIVPCCSCRLRRRHYCEEESFLSFRLFLFLLLRRRLC